MDIPSSVAIVSCKVFAPELAYLGVDQEKITFLEQGLHDHPQKLRKQISETLSNLESDQKVNTVVLLYGYCGGGLEGICSQRVRLIAPIVHDCIPVLLNRKPPFSDLSTSGSFYLSPGWIDYGETPLTEYYRTCERFDPETALWVSKEIMKNYHDVALISQKGLINSSHRAYARKMAKLFDLSYREVNGGFDWLYRLLDQRKGSQVLTVPKGKAITMFDYSGVGLSGSVYTTNKNA